MIGALRSPPSRLVDRLRRLGLSRPAMSSALWRSAATGSSSRRGGRTSPQLPAPRHGRADPSGPGEPAQRRFGRPCRRQGATTWSISSASCRRAAGSASRRSRREGAAADRDGVRSGRAALTHVSALGADAALPLGLCAHQGRGRGRRCSGRAAGCGDSRALACCSGRATASSTASRRSPACCRCCRSPAPRPGSSRSMPATSPRRSRGRSTARSPGGRVYELGGPEVRTLREFVETSSSRSPSARRFVVPLPSDLARAQGSADRHARSA